MDLIQKIHTEIRRENFIMNSYIVVCSVSGDDTYIYSCHNVAVKGPQNPFWALKPSTRNALSFCNFFQSLH